LKFSGLRGPFSCGGNVFRSAAVVEIERPLADIIPGSISRHTL